MEPEEIIVFNGTEYKLMGAGKYYLSQSNSNEGRRKAKGLHVAIWEHYNQTSVPKGYHVHHKDEDTFNNDPPNLELKKKGKHLGEHSKRWHSENQEKSKEMMSNIRLKASEWHKSDEGRKWHSEQCKKVWENKKNYLKICEFCKKEYETPFSDTKYCAQKCCTLASIERNKYEYSGICVMCGNEFMAMRLSESKPKRETCSRTCQNRLVHKNRKDRQK